MVSPFNNPSLFHNHDAVSILDGRQPVGYHKCRPPLHQFIHAPLYQFLRPGIDGGCGFIQDKYRRIRHRRPGNRQQLPLSLAQASPVPGENRLITFRQTPDEAVGICQLRGSPAFLVGGLQTSVTDPVNKCVS